MNTPTQRLPALLSLTLALGGCGLTQYNGVWGEGKPPSEYQAKLEAFKEQSAMARREGELRESRADLGPGTQVNPVREAAPQRPVDRYVDRYVDRPVDRPVESAQASVYTASQVAYTPPAPAQRAVPASASVNALHTFGSVPEQSPAALEGAMDSPDNLRRITFALDGADFDPEVDPTGSRLVFASTQHRRTADIYLKTVQGQSVTQLTNDPADDVMPTFSPDGQQVAFCSNRTGNWDIYLMDLSGAGQPVQLTAGPSHEVHPTFSPDGRHLAFSSFNPQSGQWEIAIVSVDNPGQARFICNGLFPNWSPTQDKLVFQRARQRGSFWFSVWTIDLVDGEGVRPTQVAASANAAAITPAWSRDGNYIVFATVVNPEDPMQSKPIQADVWVMAADGSGRANLTNSPFANLQPTFAPDGSIFFVSNRAEEGYDNIWSMKPNRAISVGNLARAGAIRGAPREAVAAATPAPAPAATPALSTPRPPSNAPQQAAATPVNPGTPFLPTLPTVPAAAQSALSLPPPKELRFDDEMHPAPGELTSVDDQEVVVPIR